MADRIKRVQKGGTRIKRISLNKYTLWESPQLLLISTNSPTATAIFDDGANVWQVVSWYTPGTHTFSVQKSLTASWQLFGAGGSGGSKFGGGGGAGGTIGDLGTIETLPAGSYSVSLGQGGLPSSSANRSSGQKGVNSTFLSQVALGGGAGSAEHFPTDTDHMDGGCGGGGRAWNTYYGIGTRSEDGAKGGNGD